MPVDAGPGADGAVEPGEDGGHFDAATDVDASTRDQRADLELLDATTPDADTDMPEPVECTPVPGELCASDPDCGGGALCRSRCDSRHSDCTLTEAGADIVCAAPAGGAISIEWDVSASANSFVITPFVADGVLQPSTMLRPSGGVSDLQTELWWQSVMADNEGWFNPVTVPATSDYLDHLEAGRWSMDLTTNASQVCWIVVEGRMGTRVEVDVYLVGVPDVTAATAATDADLQAALEHASAIYAGVGLDLDFVRYVDPSPDDVIRYSILPDLQAAREMFTIADPESPSADAILRVPLFLVDTMMEGRGFSPGIPAPPGLMRTRANGVAVSTSLLGEMPMGSFDPRVQDGNAVTGTFIAHEIGHYLGLQHTTEASGMVWDPLGDTPQCGPTLDLTCPDVDNLMFPFAADNHTVLTADQTTVLRFNPVLR